MPHGSEAQLLRVTIVAGQRRIDVALPTQVHVGELVPELIRSLGVAYPATLVDVLGVPVEAGRSLGEQDVRPGSTLLLQPLGADEAAVHDDLPEAVESTAGATSQTPDVRSGAYLAGVVLVALAAGSMAVTLSATVATGAAVVLVAAIAGALWGGQRLSVCVAMAVTACLAVAGALATELGSVRALGPLVLLAVLADAVAPKVGFSIGGVGQHLDRAPIDVDEVQSDVESARHVVEGARLGLTLGITTMALLLAAYSLPGAAVALLAGLVLAARSGRRGEGPTGWWCGLVAICVGAGVLLSSPSAQFVAPAAALCGGATIVAAAWAAHHRARWQRTAELLESFAVVGLGPAAVVVLDVAAWVPW